MNIYIKIEIKVRELESRLLLALCAADRGHDVILGPHELTLTLLEKKILKPGILLEKSITPADSRIKQLKNYKKIGSVITSIDEEGGFIDNDFIGFMNQRYGEETVKLADAIFTWGNHDYNLLKKKFIKYKEKIINTGNPRVDFWRPEFNKYFNLDRKKTIKKNKKYFLIASNFGSMLHEQRIWQDVILNRENKYFDRGFDEYWNYDFQAYQLRLTSKFIFALRHISTKFSNYNIIIRPHPTESVEAWKAVIGNYKNIFVIKEGSIGKWVRNSELVMHNSCTSGIESFAANIPTIVYRPLRSKFERKYPNYFGMQAFSPKDLENKVRKIINKNKHKIDLNKKKIINNKFKNLRGKFAFENIVDHWEKFDCQKLSKKNNINKLKVIGTLKDIREKNYIKKFLRNNNYFDRKKFKFPPIKKEELNHIVRNIKLSLSRFDNIEVDILSSKLIRVFKKK